jgi:hypothetical protein
MNAKSTRRQNLEAEIAHDRAIYRNWKIYWNSIYQLGVAGSIVTSLAAGTSAADLAAGGEVILRLFNITEETQITVTAILAFLPTILTSISAGFKAEAKRRANRMALTHIDNLKTNMLLSDWSQKEIADELNNIRTKQAEETT